MITIYEMLFGWMPAVVQVVVLGLIAVLLIILIIKIVGMVMNMLPW